MLDVCISDLPWPVSDRLSVDFSVPEESESGSLVGS